MPRDITFVVMRIFSMPSRKRSNTYEVEKIKPNAFQVLAERTEVESAMHWTRFSYLYKTWSEIFFRETQDPFVNIEYSIFVFGGRKHSFEMELQ